MNLTFSRLGTYGRLGNAMFQIAGVLGLAEKHKAQAYFPNWSYERAFELPLPHGPMEPRQLQEQSFHYHEWPITGSCDLLGYFQSENYFPSNIREVFKFKDEFVNFVRNKADAAIFSRETICLQIRRGDYVGNPNYHAISIEYYIDALCTYFPNYQDYNIVFFSDDIGYCRLHFECLPNAYFCDNMSDIEQMCLSTMLDHFIIPNSSFGWWCAWLGEKEHSKMIHCGHLQAGPLLEKNGKEKDYYPKRWIRHQKDSYKINLRDVTFTIPVMRDHSDRHDNIDLNICYLMTSYETNIIIGEQGTKAFEYTNIYGRYMHFEGMKDFHRTKMLNDMARKATTNIVVNWDADVFVPPMQMLLSIQQIREGKMQFMYPYDGRFVRLPRAKWFPLFQKFIDAGLASNTPSIRIW